MPSDSWVISFCGHRLEESRLIREQMVNVLRVTIVRKIVADSLALLLSLLAQLLRAERYRWWSLERSEQVNLFTWKLILSTLGVLELILIQIHRLIIALYQPTIQSVHFAWETFLKVFSNDETGIVQVCVCADQIWRFVLVVDVEREANCTFSKYSATVIDVLEGSLTFILILCLLPVANLSICRLCLEDGIVRRHNRLDVLKGFELRLMHRVHPLKHTVGELRHQRTLGDWLVYLLMLAALLHFFWQLKLCLRFTTSRFDRTIIQACYFRMRHQVVVLKTVNFQVILLVGSLRFHELVLHGRLQHGGHCDVRVIDFSNLGVKTLV